MMSSSQIYQIIFIRPIIKVLFYQFLKNNPEIADNLEAEIRRNFDKLMTGQSRVAAKAAGRAVDVSADDFKDED